MAGVVTMVRGRGYVGGWVPYVAVTMWRRYRVRADALVNRFYDGESVGALAWDYRLPLSVVEDVLRWDFRRRRHG